MTYIAFADEKKSDIVPKILNELTSFSDNLKFTLNDLESDGSLIEEATAFYAFKNTNNGWKIYALSDITFPPSNKKAN